jgi:hypothetical protein
LVSHVISSRSFDLAFILRPKIKIENNSMDEGMNTPRSSKRSRSEVEGEEAKQSGVSTTLAEQNDGNYDIFYQNASPGMLTKLQTPLQTMTLVPSFRRQPQRRSGGFSHMRSSMLLPFLSLLDTPSHSCTRSSSHSSP